MSQDSIVTETPASEENNWAHLFVRFSDNQQSGLWYHIIFEWVSVALSVYVYLKR